MDFRSGSGHVGCEEEARLARDRAGTTARQLGISRGGIYYLSRTVPYLDRAVMQLINESHLLYPFAGSRMLRDLLRQEGTAVKRLYGVTLMKRMRIEAI